MSAPNKSYDPRTVASLAPDEVTRALDEALAAIAAARTLEELKSARIAHDGDRAPLSLARGEIGALPPEARADAGRRVSMDLICTGEVWVRNTMPDLAPLCPACPAMKIVSCISRAGWSGGMFSASKLYHSASTSGPSATS